MPTVTYQVPATSANLGPGFDALGLAVSLHNQITVRTATEGPTIPFFSAAALPFFQSAALSPFPFEVTVVGDVPQSRGLGSSVTVRLGLLLGLNDLAGGPLTAEEVLSLTIDLEGHPDNAVPALYGGFCVSNGHSHFRAEISPELRLVAVIPQRNLETTTAREVLPKRIDFAEAIENIQNASLITAAFVSGQYHHLQDHLRDRLHQPYRLELMPGASEAILAAERAGALGAYLSGAGSTLMALTTGNEEPIAEAMSHALEAAGEDTPAVHFLEADNRGAFKLA